MAINLLKDALGYIQPRLQLWLPCDLCHYSWVLLHRDVAIGWFGKRGKKRGDKVLNWGAKTGHRRSHIKLADINTTVENTTANKYKKEAYLKIDSHQ